MILKLDLNSDETPSMTISAPFVIVHCDTNPTKPIDIIHNTSFTPSTFVNPNGNINTKANRTEHVPCEIINTQGEVPPSFANRTAKYMKPNITPHIIATTEPVQWVSL
eukprot:596375_1